MFEFVISAVTSRTDHPILFGLFILAGVFVLGGIVTQLFTSNGVVAGFFIIYAMLTTVIGVVGYTILYTVRFASVIRARSA